MRERRARRESLADARPRHREATTRARTSFAGDRAVGATRGVGDARRGPFESHSSRSDGPRRGKRHVMGLHHASLRIVCVTCTRGFLFFVPVVHAGVSSSSVHVCKSIEIRIGFPLLDHRRRAARAMATRWGTSGVSRADVDARRAIDRSIDRFRLLSSRSRPSIETTARALERAFGATARALASARARARDMTFKIFVGGARVDSNAVLSDAWNSSSVRALYSRAREASGERREARCAPNLGVLSNAHFSSLSDPSD